LLILLMSMRKIKGVRHLLFHANELWDDSDSVLQAKNEYKARAVQVLKSFYKIVATSEEREVAERNRYEENSEYE
jgi:hypothetical protein